MTEDKEQLYFDAPFLDKYRDDHQLLADFQYYCDLYWYKNRHYPSEKMFNAFINLSLVDRYILLNGDRND